MKLLKVGEISKEKPAFINLNGNIIATGTSSGVGMGRTPQVFLKKGDEMELRIDGLGFQKQKVVKKI